jgi:hypothetical protein
MPPQNQSSSSNIQVVTGGQTHGPKKILLIFLGLIILLIGVGAAIYIGQSQQRARGEAWGCSNYIFNVSQTGLVTVTNSSLRNEPAQKVSISINGQSVGILDVPALAIGGSTNLGSVPVPENGAFTWETTGTIDCKNQGSYQATITPVPTIPEPTIPEPTLIPTVTITPTTIPETPTSVPPTPTPIVPTSTITPTTIPNPSPGPLNKCNGTCGSDANCEPQFICSAGRCRNPSCSDQMACACPPARSTVTPTPVSTLPKSGNSSSTWIMFVSSLLLIGTSVILAL